MLPLPVTLNRVKIQGLTSIVFFPEYEIVTSRTHPSLQMSNPPALQHSIQDFEEINPEGLMIIIYLSFAIENFMDKSYL